MRKNLRLILLGLILISGFFLRFVNINNNPPALYGDELTLVYDAYSILKTGHDQLGNFLPLTFSMSEGRPPVYVYLSIPFVAIFGPNEISARLLSVLSGIGLIWLIYLITKKFFDQKTALLAALLAAINPWDLALSRGGFETHLALFLATLGVYLFLQSNKRPWLMVVAATAFGLSLHTYHSYKITVFLLLPLLFWYNRIRKGLLNSSQKKCFLTSGIIFGFFLFLWLIQVVIGTDIRFKNANIFNNTEISAQIIQNVNLERNNDQVPLLISSIFHNKFSSYSLLIGENYIQHFSENFLFLHGDGNPRHNPTLMGGFYIVELILILLSLAVLFQTNKRLLVFLLGWIMIAPLATVLTSGPHALRSSFMLPPLLILSASGFSSLKMMIKKTSIVQVANLVIITAFVFQFFILADRLYFLSPNQFGNFWSYSAKQAALVVEENQNNFNYIILSTRVDNLEYAIPVYLKLSPSLVIEQNQAPTNLLGYQFKKFGNLYLGSLPKESIKQFINSLSGSVFYIGSDSEKSVFPELIPIAGNQNQPLFYEYIKR